jgi:alkylation response protein AidB-like acyl-CoA dehydrogenase
MLIDGSRAGDLFLDRIEVAETDVVARGKDAVALIEGALSRAMVGALAAAVGSMEVCVDLCCEYLKTRWQFGQPLGKFQALQHMMAQMLLTAHNARSMLYHALSNFEAEPEVRHASLASAQRMISQSSLMVSRAGIQLHGAYGITDEYAISHHHRFHYMLEKRFGDAALIHAEQQLMGDEVPVGSRPTCI